MFAGKHNILALIGMGKTHRLFPVQWLGVFYLYLEGL